MLPALAHDIAFLAPGLVHQFGNLFLTIQGHAVQLDAESTPRAQPAIRTACERGGTALRLLRHLLGETGPERADGAAVLAQLGELLRIPVREAGHVLAPADAPPGHAGHVDLATFVPMVVATVRAVLAAAPAGLRGLVDLRFSATGARSLEVTMRPPAGDLPFPLALDDALRQLRAQGRQRGWPEGVRQRADGIEFPVPMADTTMEA